MRTTLVPRIPRWLPILFAAAVSPAAAQNQATGDSAVQVIEGMPAMVFLAASDLNSDGRLDLAAIEHAAQRHQGQQRHQARLHLFFQKGSGFGPASKGTTPFSLPRKSGQSPGFSMPPGKSLDLPTSASGLVVGDFDRDGKNDLAVGLRSQRSLAIYLGGEDFGKTHVSEYNNDSGGGGLCWGHINADRLADFMTGAAWRKWLGADRFSTGYFCGPERNDNWFSTLADLNWDGKDDLVFTTGGHGNPKGTNNLLRIYYGPMLKMGLVGADAAAEVVTLTSPLADRASLVLRQVMVADLNGDSQPDLAVGAPNQTFVYLQNSPIGFTQGAGPSLVLEGVTPLVADDLDGDGLCDLVLRGADGKSISIRYQRPGQMNRVAWLERSEPQYHHSLPRAVVAIAAGDANGDGGKELFVAPDGGGLVIVAGPTGPASSVR